MSTATLDTVQPAFFDWREMARRIGKGEQWVRRHMNELPHHRLPGNRVSFSDECVRLYLEQTLVNPNDMGRTDRSKARKGARR